MRRHFLVLALPLAWVACFSNSSGGGGGPSFDASTDGAEFDSSTVDSEPAEAGQDSPAPVDAVADVALDVPADVPVLTPVTVTVLGALGLESGVTVVYEDSTGAVTGTGTTNALGSASKVVPAGSMVTVLLGTAAAPNLYTAMGVQPGNNVVVVDWASATALANLYANVTAIPTSPALPAVSSYAVIMGGCNQGWVGTVPGSFWLTASPPCIGIGQFGASFGAAFPLLVEADDMLGNLLGFAFSKNNGLSMLDDAGMADVALTGTWSSSTTTQALAVTTADGGTMPATLVYSEIADGLLNPLSQYLDADAGGNQVVHTHAGTPAFADFVQLEASTINIAARAIAWRGPPPTADGTATIDVSAFATAPTITNASVAITTPGQPTVSWTLSQGSLASVTGLVATTNWSASLPEGGTQFGTWTIVAPGTAQTSVTAPALPSASSGFAPASGASTNMTDFYAVDGNTATPSAIPTYGDLLLISTTLYPQSACFFAPYLPALPHNGTAALTVWAPGGC